MDDDGAARLQGDPDLFVRIAENALVVAEELRQDYVHSTLGIARRMREEFRSDTLLFAEPTRGPSTGGHPYAFGKG